MANYENFKYDLGKYILRILDKNNKKELEEVQRLRYNDLLKEFNPSLPDNGIDDDGYDKYAESLIVLDKEKGIIVGTYRLASTETGASKLLMEGEFDISSLKETNDKILELGRAVVKKEYRDGTVINILWSGIFQFAMVYNYRFLLGTCSLHGTDPTIHSETLSYLRENYVSRYPMMSVKNSFSYPTIPIAKEKVEKEIPSLLKAYLRLGAKVSTNGYIDYDFNSCDVITIVDVKEISPRYIDFYTRKFKK